jgi:hypothetical protein
MRSTPWNDINSGKPKNSEKDLSQCHFVHHKSHLLDLGANPGCRGEKPATNCLSHGTTSKYCTRNCCITSRTDCTKLVIRQSYKCHLYRNQVLYSRFNTLTKFCEKKCNKSIFLMRSFLFLFPLSLSLCEDSRRKFTHG